MGRGRGQINGADRSILGAPHHQSEVCVSVTSERIRIIGVRRESDNDSVIKNERGGCQKISFHPSPYFME